MYVIHAFLLTFVVAAVAARQPRAWEGAGKQIAEVRYNWRYINYTWPSAKEYDRAIKNGDYVPKNNSLIGIKVWKDKFYFAIPRRSPGVPVSMATAPVNGDDSPNLEPFPNWKMQKLGDCDALQFVQSMEIDPKGRMWVIDNGRIDIFDKSKSLCPQRLMIFDLENENKVLLNYVFPKDVVDRDTVYLNDIVLDHTDGGYAYITNADDEKPSIIVFSLAKLTSWQVRDESMKATDVNIMVKGEPLPFTKASTVNGIALESADLENHRKLYFTPLSSRRIFYVNTKLLKSRKNISDHVCILKSTPRTHTAGMIVNSDNKLFFGMLEENTVGVWMPSARNYRRAYTDPKLQWIDTYAIDVDGNMWATINRMPRILAGTIDIRQINYRVVKLDRTGFKNYQYYKNGSAPKLPVI